MNEADKKLNERMKTRLAYFERLAQKKEEREQKKWGELCERDYVYGYDEGEQRGARE